MTISTILAAGLTAGASTDITIAKGDSVNVGVFSNTAGAIPSAHFDILQVTPGVPNVIGSVGPARAVNIAGPGVQIVEVPFTMDAAGTLVFTAAPQSPSTSANVSGVELVFD